MPERGFNLTFSYDDTPPSFNSVGHSGNRWTWTKAEKKWKEIVEGLMLSTGFPRDWDHIAVRVRLTFPTKQRRDVVNYRTLLEKATGDALVNGKWIPDDIPEHFVFEDVRFEQKTGPKRTTWELVAK
jgi:hypothetical protein